MVIKDCTISMPLFRLTPVLRRRRVGAWYFSMQLCAFCKTKITALYENGVPICLDCASGRTGRKSQATDQQTRSLLLQDILKLTARINEATTEFDKIMRQVPSGLPHPDGMQRMKNVSVKLSMARQELMKAHRRLDDYVESGTVPEDLKQVG
jgi:hypothetical protein